MTKVTITLTDDQIRSLITVLESSNNRTKRIIDTPETFNKASIIQAKVRYAFRQRIVVKLAQALVTEQAKTV